MADWQAVRAEFPAVTRRVYLNTAGGGPVSRRAAEAGRRYYELTLEDGDVHWDAWLERVDEVRAAVARLIGADPDEIAFVGNASTALSIAAHMLADRGGVVTVEDEFPPCTLPWLQLGHDVSFAGRRRNGTVTLEDLEEALDRRPASARREAPGVLAVSFVQFRSGFRFDLGELGELCADRELELVVDATQGLGAFPVDVGAARVGFLASSGYKWLTAGYGVAILQVRSELLEPAGVPGGGMAERPGPVRPDLGRARPHPPGRRCWLARA